MSIKNNRSEPKEILGLHRITKKRLLELCKKDKLYQTPSLNDVLYLHYQGFQCIECLDDYTELKCLWLECNALSEIQGLENQTKLKCLFLQSNLIKKIENLESCKELDTINLSQNQIRKIENISSDVLPVLNTLNLSSNYIKDCEGLRELENCKNLSVVDLSNNRIDDILVVKIFSKMPELKVLILQGNPVVSKIPQYRKTLILECRNLTYLDSRPVFPKDRACAEVWKRGGYQEERKENDRWNRKDRKKIRDSVNATIRMRNKHRKPEDHLALLVSSDSEDESAEKKRRKQQQDVDAGVSMEMGMWDEVAGDDNKSETTSSSDMNVSSSTSVISTTDSNGDTSSKEEEESQRVDYEEIKILNVPMDRINDEACHLMACKNVETIKEFVDKRKLGERNGNQKCVADTKIDSLETVETNRLDASKDAEVTDSRKEQIDFNPDNDLIRNSKKIELNQKIEVDICSNSLGKTNDTHLDTVCALDDKLLQKDAGSGHLEECETLKPMSLKSEHITNSGHNTSDESEDAKESYDHTIEAIYRVTMNNLSDTEMCGKDSEKRVYLQIETNDENYEPMGEMEEAMNTMVTKEDVEREKVRELNAQLDGQNLKSQLQLDFDQKCLHANEEVRKDFERMSSNMDVAMAQFQRDQEERKEVIEALFSIKESNKEISSGDSGDEAKVVDEENLRIERMVNQWDRETKLKGGKRNEETDRMKLDLNSVTNNNFGGSQAIVKDHAEKINGIGKLEAVPNTIERDENHLFEVFGKNDQDCHQIVPDHTNQIYEISKLEFKSTDDASSLIERNEKHLSEVFGKNEGSHPDKDKSKYDQKENKVKEMVNNTSKEESPMSYGISRESVDKMGNPCCSPTKKEEKISEFLSSEDKDEKKGSFTKNDEKILNVDSKTRINIGATTKSYSIIGCPKQSDSRSKKKPQVENECTTSKMQKSLKTDPEINNFAVTHDKDFYQPLDVTSLTRASNNALESFEKEAKQLKDLLQKLEVNNEQVFGDLNSEVQCGNVENSKEIKEQQKRKSEMADRIQEQKREINMKAADTAVGSNQYNKAKDEKEKLCDGNNRFEGPNTEAESTSDVKPVHETISEDSVGVICEQTIGDIIKSLDLKPRKPLSFEFPPELELEEDNNEYAKELPLSRTIRNVIESFNDLFRNTISSNPERTTEQICVEKRDSFTSCEKTTILKELVNSENLKQFNHDTHESLDAQLSDYKEERCQEVRGIVDRVYAQKERYNDTIELIDGKLMVVHKDTGELTELPPSRLHPFNEDSDTDYDTAESDEEDGACCSKPRVRSDANSRSAECGPYASADAAVESGEEDGACCSKPRFRSDASVRPRKCGSYTSADAAAESGEEDGACCSKPRVRSDANSRSQKCVPYTSADAAVESGEETGACCSKQRVRSDANSRSRKCGPYTSADAAVESTEEDGACCGKPRVRSRVNVWPRKWGPYSLADYKPTEVLMHQALDSVFPKVTQRNPEAIDESDEEDDFYSLDTQNLPNAYGNMDKETFDAMTFDHLNLSEQDESHIVQCVRSYEELKHMLKTHKEERRLTPEENELLEKMVESKHSKEGGIQQQQQQDGGEIPLQDKQLRKLMERTREYNAANIENKKSSERLNERGKETETETTLCKTSREPIQILEYKPLMIEGEITAPDERHQEMDEFKDVSFVGNVCTDDYLVDNRDGVADNISRQRVLDLKNYEFLESKDIKENINRIEQRSENKIAECVNVQSLSENLVFSGNEKNEIEYNVDIEGIRGKTEIVTKERNIELGSIMVKTEIVTKERSFQSSKETLSKAYPSHSHNSALTFELTQEEACNKRNSSTDNNAEDCEKLSKDVKETANIPINKLAEVRETTFQVKATADELKRTTQISQNSNNITQNGKTAENPEIDPFVILLQPSALCFNTMSDSQNIEEIPQSSALPINTISDSQKIDEIAKSSTLAINIISDSQKIEESSQTLALPINAISDSQKIEEISQSSALPINTICDFDSQKIEEIPQSSALTINQISDSQTFEEVPKSSALPINSDSQKIEEIPQSSALPINIISVSQKIEEIPQSSALSISTILDFQKIKQISQTSTMPINTTSYPHRIEEISQSSALPIASISDSQKIKEISQTSTMPINTTSYPHRIEEIPQSSALPINIISVSQKIEEIPQSSALPISTISDSQKIKEISQTSTMPINTISASQKIGKITPSSSLPINIISDSQRIEEIPESSALSINIISDSQKIEEIPQSSALAITTISDSQKIEEIHQVYVEELHATKMIDIDIECSSNNRTYANNSQQYSKASEIPANTSHIEICDGNLNNKHQIGSLVLDTEEVTSELSDTNQKAGELEHLINTPITSDLNTPNLTELSRMPVKLLPDIDFLHTNFKESTHFDFSNKNIEHQPETELPDVENKSPTTPLYAVEDILECNLEILGCNEDVIDTITVNAEIHYEN